MKELVLVRHLVHHPESKRKVDGLMDADGIRFAEMGDDTSFYALLFSPFFEVPASIGVWTSAAMTLPLSPTIRARGMEKYPIPGPTSSTVSPS